MQFPRGGRHATGFDTVVEVDGQTVRLTRDITDLIFVEG